MVEKRLELIANQVLEIHALPLAPDQQIDRTAKAVHALREPFLELLGVSGGARRLPRHRLDDGENVLGSVR